MRSISPHAGLLIALVLAGVLYVDGLGKHGMFMWDEAHYAVLGRALARGEGYVDPAGRPEPLRPPMLPAAVAAVLLTVPGDNDTTLLYLSVAAGLLLTAVVYGCVYRRGGAFAASAAALVFATFPETWRSTSYLLTELPLALFYTLAVFFFHRGLYVDSRYFFASWPCFALALMTRYTAVLFGPTALLLCAVPLLFRDREALARMRSIHFVIAPVVAAAMLAPLFARAWLELGDPLIGFRAASRQLPEYSRHARMPVHYYVSTLPGIIGWLPTVGLGIAMAEALAHRDRLTIHCAVAAAVIIAWMSQYGWKEPRLVSASLPFLAIAIGVGLQRIHSRAPVAVQVAAAVAFAAAVQLDPAYPRTRLSVSNTTTLGYPSFIASMQEVRRATAPSAVLMGPNCYQIAWYADRACRPTPSDRKLRESGQTFESFLAGVDHLVVTSFERGQPAYLTEVLARAERDFPGHVDTYSDNRFWTKIIDARLLAGADASDAAGAPPPPAAP